MHPQDSDQSGLKHSPNRSNGYYEPLEAIVQFRRSVSTLLTRERVTGVALTSAMSHLPRGQLRYRITLIGDQPHE